MVQRLETKQGREVVTIVNARLLMKVKCVRNLSAQNLCVMFLKSISEHQRTINWTSVQERR